MTLMTSDRLASMIDPDIIAAIRMLAADDTTHQAARQKRHDHQTTNQIETALSLLSDEVERIIPRSSPLFESVLLLAAINKVAKQQEEPEYKSSLEDFPQGW
jgi:hypothetical protein